jgi:tripartite motif-containing protein 71
MCRTLSLAACLLLALACGKGTLGGADGVDDTASVDAGTDGAGTDAVEVSPETTPDLGDASSGPGRCDQQMALPSLPPPEPDLAEMQAPSGVAVVLDTVFVADPIKGRVLVFTTLGTFIESFEAFDGMPEGETFQPYGVAADGEHLFVSDTAADRVLKVTRGGVLVKGWDGGSASGKFDAPLGLALSEGELFVADSGNGRVQVFSTTGSWRRDIGAQGEAGERCVEPTAVAVGGDEVFVADKAGQRVQVYTRSGVHARTIDEGLSEPTGVTFGDGILFVADRGLHQVSKFLVTGERQASCGGEGDGAGQLFRPRDVRYGSGSLFIADTGNGRVLKLFPH